VKILLDHCLPKRLKQLFPTHEVKTAREKGWADYKNGKLLAAAGTEFDVFLTIDKNIKHQQNLDALPVSIIVIIAINNRFETLAPCIPEVEKILLNLKPKTLVEVKETAAINRKL
jgi:predicted nuclease of predicted toxin-antitoxin system